MSTSKNLDPRRLVHQIAFCDPQIPEYFVVLENNFPASQQRLEVFRGTRLTDKVIFRIFQKIVAICIF